MNGPRRSAPPRRTTRTCVSIAQNAPLAIRPILNNNNSVRTYVHLLSAHAPVCLTPANSNLLPAARSRCHLRRHRPRTADASRGKKECRSSPSGRRVPLAHGPPVSRPAWTGLRPIASCGDPQRVCGPGERSTRGRAPPHAIASKLCSAGLRHPRPYRSADSTRARTQSGPLTYRRLPHDTPCCWSGIFQILLTFFCWAENGCVKHQPAVDGGIFVDESRSWADDWGNLRCKIALSIGGRQLSHVCLALHDALCDAMGEHNRCDTRGSDRTNGRTIRGQ